MAKKTEKKPNPGRFKPGQSGNPSGRPKKNRDLEQLVQSKLEQEDGNNLAIDYLLAQVQGDTSNAQRAAEMLLAYGYGKPTQRVVATGEDGGPIRFQELSAAKDLLRALLAKGRRDDSGS